VDVALSTIAVPRTLLRGERRPRVALVGRLRTGKSTLFRTPAAIIASASSTSASNRFRWSICRRSVRCTR